MNPEVCKKTILILANSDSGLLKFRGLLIMKLIEAGHQVIVSVPVNYSQKNLEDLGCQVIATNVDRRGINPLVDLKLICKYRSLIHEYKPDYVITYTIKPNIYGGMICRLYGVPYAVNVTGLGTTFQKDGLLKKLVVVMYKLALKRASITFFENSANMEIFCQLKICTPPKCKLLNGAGVDLSHFNYQPYPTDNETTRFLFIGRVMKEKGIDELFDAMDRLWDEGLNCALDVLGSYEEDYKATIDQYTKKGWLTYHGVQKDVRPYIGNAHCAVLPSWHEGMSNSNLECAASGRPVITSNIPGCREAVVPGISGLLCESQNADSLYQTMKAFLAMPHEQRKAMGIAGRKHMEAVFDKRKVVAETIRYLGI